MAFLSGCHGANEYDDYDGDDNDIDIADQPTQPIERPTAALAIAQAQMLLAERDVLTLPQSRIVYRSEQIYGAARRSTCPLCCMDAEEKMQSFLTTDGALLLICDYHIQQIKQAKHDEEVDLFAEILHVAYQRYSWPPGEEY